MTTLLVADDDGHGRKLIGMLFAEQGYQLCFAKNNQEALDIMRDSEEPLIVPIDHLMPSMNSEVLLQHVASDPHLAQQHQMLFLSGANESLQARSLKIMQALSILLLGKPFALEELEACVTQAKERLQ